MNYNYSEGDPKEIKKILEGSRVKCTLERGKTIDISKGDISEILIKGAFFEHDSWGIWWELDIVLLEEDLEIKDVIVCSPSLISDFVLQIEGQETLKRLKNQYLVDPEEEKEYYEKKSKRKS